MTATAIKAGYYQLDCAECTFLLPEKPPKDP
jgi:hypothetical protein